MTTQLSKQDYLKKYLNDGDKGKKKKKKKVTQNSIIKSKIIDDDIDLKNMKVVDSDDLEIYDLAEEAPQIAGFIDERPEEVRLMSEYRGTKKWRIVADEFGIEDVKVLAIEDKGENECTNNGILDSSKEKSKNKADSYSPSGKNHKIDSNCAPPRISSKQDDSNVSPPRKVDKENYDSDVSPPRKSSKKYDSDASPPRNIDRRERSDSDVSPPRKSNRECDSDASPPRKWKKRCSSDASPPRGNKKKKSNRDASPEESRKQTDLESVSGRKGKQDKYDSDASPPRKSKRNGVPDDKSTRRKSKNRRSNSISSVRKRSDSDSPPPKVLKKEKSDTDSPNIRNGGRHSERHNDSVSNRSSGEISKKTRSNSSDTESRWKELGFKTSENRSKSSKKKDDESLRGGSKLGNTLEGKKSGLQNAKELRKEIEELKERQKKESVSASGKDETVIVRDRKTGLRVDPKEEARKKRLLEEKNAERIAQYAVWGKGVKQVQDSQEKLKDDLYEMSKPLARYADDKDLDEMLKNKEWEGDPMLEYIRKKRKKESSNDKPQYEGSYMPNRYGIKPGYRWDGVDRSNGYEKKWFEMQNAKKAREEEAFKWSTADM